MLVFLNRLVSFFMGGLIVVLVACAPLPTQISTSEVTGSNLDNTQWMLVTFRAWIEEGYWRGLLLDAASGWPGWRIGAYSAVFFGASHPLIFGWQAGDALNGIAGFLGTLIAGLIWGLVYRQTRSLRLPILGHFLQQMLEPPYNVFIQLAAILG